MRAKTSKILSTAVVIILLLGILLAVTNPQKESHSKAISDRLSEKDTITDVLNRGSMMINPPIYHNLGFFSYTRHDRDITTIGILGFVWVNEKAFK